MVAAVSTTASVASLFFFNDTATTEIYTLSLHDALPISNRSDRGGPGRRQPYGAHAEDHGGDPRSEEHTSELQSLAYLVCRLLLERKKTTSPMLDPTRVAMRIHSTGARPGGNEKAPHAAA